MVRLALATLLRDRSIDEICALAICDPAIGEGAFVDSIVSVIAEALVARGMPHETATHSATACVYGIDIDERAVAATKLRHGGNFLVGDALEIDWRAAFPGVFARGG